MATTQLGVRVPTELRDLTRDYAVRHGRGITAEVVLALELDCTVHALTDAYGKPESDRDLGSEPLAPLRSELEERLARLVADLTRDPPSSLSPLAQAIQEATAKAP